MAYIIGNFAKNNQNLNLYLYYDYTQDVDNNTSTVTATLKIKKVTSYAETHANTNWYININGKKKSGTFAFDCRKTSVGSFITIASYTVSNIPHNNDGSKEIKLSAEFNLSKYNPGRGYVEKNITLDTIPRASSLIGVKDSYALGDIFDADIQSYSDSFYHKLTIKLNKSNTIHNVAPYTNDTNITISKAWINKEDFKDSVSANATITLYTYKSSNYTDTNKIGEKSYNITLFYRLDNELIDYYNLTTVFTSMNNNEEYGDLYIKNKTACRIRINASPKNGGEITDIKITGSDGYNYSINKKDFNKTNISYNVEVITDIITTSPYKYTISITDSRGVTYSNDYSINVIEYYLPYFKSILSKRATIEDNIYEENDDGTVLKSILDFDYFKHDSSNTLELAISYTRINNGNTVNRLRTFKYTNNNLVLLSTTYNDVFIIHDNPDDPFEIYWANNFNTDDSYEITYILTDKYNTISRTDILSSAYCILDIGRKGKSIAFGKTASDTEDIMEIAIPLNIYIGDRPVKLTQEIVEEDNSFVAIITLSKNKCTNTIFNKRVNKLTISVDDISNDEIITGIYGKIMFATLDNIEIYPSSIIYFIGDQTSNGVFTPNPNTYYLLTYEWIYDKILCYVYGIEFNPNESHVLIPEGYEEPEQGTGGETGGGEGEGNEGNEGGEGTGGNTEPTPDPLSVVTAESSYGTSIKNNGMSYWRMRDRDNERYSSTNIWQNGTAYRSSNTPCSGTANPEKDVTGSIWVKCEGKYYKSMDCSTLVLLCLQDYSYENGPYSSLANFNAYRAVMKQHNANSTWGIYTARSAADIAKFFFDQPINAHRGIVYYKDVTEETNTEIGSTNVNDLQPGDIIFYSRKTNGNWKQPDRFNYISHASIYCGNTNSANNNLNVVECTSGIGDKRNTSTSSSNCYVGLILRPFSEAQPNTITMIVRVQDDLITKLRSEV